MWICFWWQIALRYLCYMRIARESFWYGYTPLGNGGVVVKLPWEEQTTLSWTWTIMPSERPAKGRIIDKVARSFGKLSNFWPPPVSSSMNMDSSSNNYITKTDAGCVYFNPIYAMSLNHWYRKDRSACDNGPWVPYIVCFIIGGQNKVSRQISPRSWL